LRIAALSLVSRDHVVMLVRGPHACENSIS
jgi:hypothetical protein